MKEVQHDILHLQQEVVLEKLTWENTYAFACWQYPNQSHSELIISLGKPHRLDAGLEDAPTGFLANAFKDNHPIHPWLIPADITIDHKGKVTVGTGVSSESVEEFLTYLENCKRPAKLSSSKQLTSGIENTNFVHFVNKIIEQIKNGEATKIVPSRFEEVSLPLEIKFSELFQTICNTYPTGFCNIWSLADGEIWAGATPESLLSFEDNVFSTVALAGTQGISPEDKLADIGWTQKEIEEQALVSRFIINCFKKLRIREFEEYGPKTIAAGSLAHLCTIFKVDLSKVHFEGLPDQMLELLHPTSAVCGMPREKTAKFLEENEGYDRSFYAGFIGPVNFKEATRLFVNLRCVRFTEGIARFYAGAGVTEDSNSEKEWVETQMKMDVMRKIINTNHD